MEYYTVVKRNNELYYLGKKIKNTHNTILNIYENMKSELEVYTLNS